MSLGSGLKQHLRANRRQYSCHIRPGRIFYAIYNFTTTGPRIQYPASLMWLEYSLLCVCLLIYPGGAAREYPPSSPNRKVSGGPTFVDLKIQPTKRQRGTNDTIPGQIDIRETLRQSQRAGEDDTFYMCPPPTGATVVRMAPPRACPQYSQGRNFTEGIGVIFKENIAPYKFKAHIYYKNVIVTTTWSGSTYAAITNQYTDRVPVKVSEITELIDGQGKCLSKADYIRSNREVTAFDRDEDPTAVRLKPSKFNTQGARGWHTTQETHVVVGSPGFYRTGTSVNCIVEEVDARSVYPYDSFALSTGDIIYMSPFYGHREEGKHEHSSYAPERFKQLEEYQARDLDTNTHIKPTTRNFLTTPHVTVAWNWVPKLTNVCSLTKWREVDALIRDTTNTSYRFTSKTMSATFVGEPMPFNLSKVHLSECVERDARVSINRIYTEKYNRTHIKVGPIQTYLVRGGFIVAFQAMVSNTLAKLYLREQAMANQTATHVRPKRSASSLPIGGEKGTPAYKITTTTGAEFAALQFTYDHIQAHVNEMFARIATAWCMLQNQEQALWRETAKLNPSVIASTMLAKKVSARMLGDVMAVSSCARLNGSNVYIQNSMRIIGDPHTCYSRPLVSFAYGNRTEYIDGQLGDDNELLTDRSLIEPCVVNHKRYFRFGANYVYYEDYLYVHTIPVAEIETISAHVDLNLVMLEDREFLPLEVYTRAELADTGLLDYSEIQRRNQLHSLKFYDIDSVVKLDNNLVIMRGMANFFQGLGDVGKAVGSVVLGAAGLALSTVKGVASFLSNPFGALALGLLVLAGLVAAFLAYRYVMRLRNNPMKALYPVTTQTLKEEARDGINSPEDFDETKLEQARDMIRYMSMVSAMEREEHKAKKKNKGTALINSRIIDMAMRRRGPKYQRLPDTETDVGKQPLYP
uniref:Glycoprotein B n=1 Tax=Lagenorhynchus alphaherpesvirus 1 TaxID=1232896 RepID=M4ZSQ8_9ALPH|nr:glycoprotein B [Lagenorhynchus alphaherpesvirus 1]